MGLGLHTSLPTKKFNVLMISHCHCITVILYPYYVQLFSLSNVYSVIIRLEDRLQSNIGNTLGRISMVFTRCGITPPKVK